MSRFILGTLVHLAVNILLVLTNGAFLGILNQEPGSDLAGAIQAGILLALIGGTVMFPAMLASSMYTEYVARKGGTK